MRVIIFVQINMERHSMVLVFNARLSYIVFMMSALKVKVTISYSLIILLLIILILLYGLLLQLSAFICSYFAHFLLPKTTKLWTFGTYGHNVLLFFPKARDLFKRSDNL